MTRLQRFVQYCIIFNTILNILTFCGVKLFFETRSPSANQQQHLEEVQRTIANK